MSFKKSMFITVFASLVGIGIFSLGYFGFSNKDEYGMVISLIAGMLGAYLAVVSFSLHHEDKINSK